MSEGLLVNSVTIARRLAKRIVKSGDVAIDATCGNGHDTVLLAQLVGEKGKVYAFDIQPIAIEKTRLLLQQHRLEKRVVLINDCHSKINQYVQEKPRICMFNLGYLPGGDHDIKTEPTAVIKALNVAIDIIIDRGVITLVFYPGHPGGRRETDIVKEYLTVLPQSKFEISEVCFINQINNPPLIIVLHKKEGS